MDVEDMVWLRWRILKHRLNAGEVSTLEQALEEAALIEAWLLRPMPSSEEGK